MRERPWGLLLSPEDVKATCGNPQQDEIFKLTYAYEGRLVELQFYGMNHREYLKYVKWSSNKDAGKIYQVTQKAIGDNVANGYLPHCLALAAQ